MYKHLVLMVYTARKFGPYLSHLMETVFRIHCINLKLKHSLKIQIVHGIAHGFVTIFYMYLTFPFKL